MVKVLNQQLQVVTEHADDILPGGFRGGMEGWKEGRVEVVHSLFDNIQENHSFTYLFCGQPKQNTKQKRGPTDLTVKYSAVSLSLLHGAAY